MSWDQIEMTARSVIRHKAQLATMVLDPIMMSMGAKKKPKDKSRRRVKQKPDKITKEERDQRRLAQLQMMGIPIREV